MRDADEQAEPKQPDPMRNVLDCLQCPRRKGKLYAEGEGEEARQGHHFDFCWTIGCRRQLWAANLTTVGRVKVHIPVCASLENLRMHRTREGGSCTSALTMVFEQFLQRPRVAWPGFLLRIRRPRYCSCSSPAAGCEVRQQDLGERLDVWRHDERPW